MEPDLIDRENRGHRTIKAIKEIPFNGARSYRSGKLYLDVQTTPTVPGPSMEPDLIDREN